MFSHSTLHTLSGHSGSPKVSLFVPTSPLTAETQDAAIHLKSLLKVAAEELSLRGLSADEAASFLHEVENRTTDRQFWQHQQHGLAFFVSPGKVTEVSVAHTVEPVAVVGDYFDVLPLMPSLATQGEYALLCASQSETVAYVGNEAELKEVTVSGLPRSLDEVVTDSDYENPVLASPPARPNAGSQNIPDAQVYGQAPPEWQAMVRRKFAQQIVSSLTSSTELQGLPLVVIADEEMAGDVAEAAGAVGVSMTHPTSLSHEQRHNVSWALAHETLDQVRQQAIGTMAERLGKDSDVASDPADIARAAIEGRVDKLFIAHTEPHQTISQSLWETLAKGGEVLFAGDSTAMPESGAVALLRY